MVLSYQRLKLAFLESTPIPFLPLLGCQRRGTLVDLRNSFRPLLYTSMDWPISVSTFSFGRTVFLLNLGAGPGCFCPTALKSQAIRRRKSFSRPRLKSLSSPIELLVPLYDGSDMFQLSWNCSMASVSDFHNLQKSWMIPQLQI